MILSKTSNFILWTYYEVQHDLLQCGYYKPLKLFYYISTRYHTNNARIGVVMTFDFIRQSLVKLQKCKYDVSPHTTR